MNQNSSSWSDKYFQDQSFRIPNIQCPFDFSRNPVGKMVKPEYEIWVKDLIPKFYKAFLKEETLEYSVMALDVDRPELFLPMVKLTDWVFIIDDIVIEKGCCSKEYIDSLFDPEQPTKDRWSQAFWSAIDDLSACSVHPFLIDRIIEEAKQWSYSAVRGIHNIEWSNLSDIEEYCRFRSYESAAHLGLAIAMASRPDFTLTQDIMEDENFKQLLLKYGGINALVNDLYSFVSEFNDKSLSNYVKINCHVNGATIQESMQKVVEYVHRGYHEMELLANKIEHQFPNNQTLQQCIQCIKRITASTVGFCSVAPRYNDQANRKALIGKSNSVEAKTNTINIINQPTSDTITTSTTTTILRG
ncbi:hypothetical protein PPL_00955 [Heterostelium album PN500]|uniref:Terpene synthase n=1 Tax=Heterostelium pallidum (strain ATCC 26659 / Pp 5 / PN500) TaxID=670386 RepID=D3AXP8_HETP5|nr:hypothetical protein PPL_00955 [Heterostelium album PN500]EFA85725.1 hypothetical protein PPL_00955 [Heterostelium album PN500]|eukprot:XP_020437831.1 hypothetical protein PPL_00955 [Heterostelium album PN500]